MFTRGMETINVIVKGTYNIPLHGESVRHRWTECERHQILPDSLFSLALAEIFFVFSFAIARAAGLLASVMESPSVDPISHPHHHEPSKMPLKPILKKPSSKYALQSLFMPLSEETLLIFSCKCSSLSIRLGTGLQSLHKQRLSKLNGFSSLSSLVIRFCISLLRL